MKVVENLLDSFRTYLFTFRMMFFMILSSCLLSFSCFSQLPFHEQITPNDGLPSVTVYEIDQSKTGHMYIGTDVGLFKYNGASFKRLSAKEVDNEEVYQFRFLNDSTFVFSNSNRELCLGVNDQITCGEIGLKNLTNVIHQLDDRLIYITSLTSNGKQEILYDFVLKKVIDTGQGGRKRKAPTTSTVLQNKGFSSDQLAPVVCLDGDNYIIRNPMIRGGVTSLYKSWEIKPFSGQFIELQYENKNAKSDKKIISEFRNTSLNTTYSLNDSILLFGTNRGLKFYNIQSQRIEKTLFEEASINSILLDQNKVLWLGTANQGIIKMPNIEIELFPFSAIPIFFDQTKNGDIVIAEDGSGYFLSDQLFEFDFSYEINQVPRSIGVYEDLNFVLTQYSLYNVDPENERHSQLTENLKISRELFNSKYMGAFKDFRITKDGDILLATSHGLFLCEIELQGKNIVVNNLKEVHNERCFKIYQYSDQLYVLTSTGLLKFDEDSESIKDFSAPLKTRNLQKISFNSEDSYLYSTKNSKLFYVTALTSKEINFSTLNLPEGVNINSHIWSNGYFYVFTDELVFQLEPSELNNPTIIPANPLIDLRKIEAIFCKEDKFSIVTKEGIIRLSKELFFQTYNSTELEVTETQVFNSRKESVPLKQSLHASHNNIELRLESPSLFAHNATTIYYAIEGLNQRYEKHNGNDLVLRLDNLKPGKYTIKAAATSQAAVPKDKLPELLSFQIRKPFWDTNIFKLLVSLAIIAITVLIMKFFQERKKRQYELLLEIDRNKNKAFKAQIKPHFIFNSLGSLLGLIATDKKEEAQKHVQQLSSFLRSTLKSSDNEWVNLNDEIKTLNHYITLENVRFSEKIKIDFSVYETIKTSHINIPPLLLQPIVENAIVHGLLPLKKGGNISIKICEYDHKNLFVEVIDDGLGLTDKPNDFHKSGGYGLKLTKERLKAITDLEEEPLVIKNNTGRGVTVNMIIPFKENL